MGHLFHQLGRSSADRPTGLARRGPSGSGGIALSTVLGAILLLTGAGALVIWRAASGVEMGKHGWIALGLGTLFSLLVGCGLMALMFLAVAAVTTMSRTPSVGETPNSCSAPL